MPPAVLAPPPTQAEPVTETLHGVQITDPYRWLEDQNSPRTRQWLEEQTAYSRGYLEAIPGREGIRKRVEELLEYEVISEPWRVGDRYFFLKRAPHQQQPSIMMRLGRTGPDTALIDPSGRGYTDATALTILNVSVDGKLLAYGLRAGGEDSVAVGVVDVDSKQVLPDQLPRAHFRCLSFASDGSGFYHSGDVIGSPNPQRRAVYWHRFGTTVDQDREIFCAGDDPNLRLIFVTSRDSSWLAYLVVRFQDTVTTDLFIHHIASGTRPRLVAAGLEGGVDPVFHGNQLLILTQLGAPNYRVVAASLETPQPAHWTDVVPESQHPIQDFAVMSDLIFVGYEEGGGRHVRIFDSQGRSRGALPTPALGTVILIRRPAGDTDTQFYSYTDFSHPPTIYSYSTTDTQCEVWSQDKVPFDPATFHVTRVFYPSKDGTLIPMFLVSPKDLSGSSPRPTVLTAYGGFGLSVTPQFSAFATFMVERGARFAVACLRGGGEFGEDWHSAGRRQNHQNTIDDFVSGAEWLLTSRYASKGKIAIAGGSNGGLLVGAALTQRPDLFRAVICIGPLLDMLRYHKFDSAGMFLDEYGFAENAEDFRTLISYSPYHRVHDETSYPAVMMISGDADTRCNPLHARKMVARLQTATRSCRPVLLDYKANWGHMPVQPLHQRTLALTDRLAFFCHELGIEV